jgi:hypothetical protein
MAFYHEMYQGFVSTKRYISNRLASDLIIGAGPGLLCDTNGYHHHPESSEYSRIHLLVVVLLFITGVFFVFLRPFRA